METMSFLCPRMNTLLSTSENKLQAVVFFLEESRKNFYKSERKDAAFLDDKILTSWNGLMISALAREGRFWPEIFTASASRAADFILSRMMVICYTAIAGVKPLIKDFSMIMPIWWQGC